MTTGLVLIDIQNDYFPGGRCELHEPLKAVENAKKVLDFFRKMVTTQPIVKNARQIEVIATKHYL